MITQLYTVQDTKVGAFLPLFPARSRGEALRSFMDACQDEKHAFNKHRGDFVLYFVGAFDDIEGTIHGLKPERVLGGDEF